MNVTAFRLAQAMQKRGWNQSDLAREIGATQGAVSKIFLGKTANSRLLPKAAAALHVSLNWLLGKTDDSSVDVVQELFSPEDLEWLDTLHRLDRTSREAVLQLARTLGRRPESRDADDEPTIPLLQDKVLAYRGQE